MFKINLYFFCFARFTDLIHERKHKLVLLLSLSMIFVLKIYETVFIAKLLISRYVDEESIKQVHWIQWIILQIARRSMWNWFPFLVPQYTVVSLKMFYLLFRDTLPVSSFTRKHFKSRSSCCSRPHFLSIILRPVLREKRFLKTFRFVRK